MLHARRTWSCRGGRVIRPTPSATGSTREGRAHTVRRHRCPWVPAPGACTQWWALRAFDLLTGGDGRNSCIHRALCSTSRETATAPVHRRTGAADKDVPDDHDISVKQSHRARSQATRIPAPTGKDTVPT